MEAGRSRRLRRRMVQLNCQLLRLPGRLNAQKWRQQRRRLRGRGTNWIDACLTLGQALSSSGTWENVQREAHSSNKVFKETVDGFEADGNSLYRNIV